jgi:hypothetical protein
VDAADFVPLSSAAATAYLSLADNGRRREVPLADGLLDVVAIALAACVPIYAARGDEPLKPLKDADLFRGMFRHGATRLHFADGRPSYDRLAVTRADLASALGWLRRAGVNFSEARFEPAPRRVPTVVPA